MVKGIGQEMERLGHGKVRCEAKVHPGRSVIELHEEMLREDHTDHAAATHVLFQGCGIDLENALRKKWFTGQGRERRVISKDDILSRADAFITDARQKYPRAEIIVGAVTKRNQAYNRRRYLPNLNEEIRRFNEQLRELALSHGAAFVHCEPAWPSRAYKRDRLHFNDEGVTTYAQNLIDHISNFQRRVNDLSQ